MNDCFICDKHAGNIDTSGITIYEDGYVYVGHIDRVGNPNYLGHLMIDLKRHVPTLGDMNMDEAMAFRKIMARVSKVLMETEKAEHIYSLVSGNSVPHLHMHLVLVIRTHQNNIGGQMMFMIGIMHLWETTTKSLNFVLV